MKFDANDYLRRVLKLKGLDERLIGLYLIIFKNLEIKPLDINIEENFISIPIAFENEKESKNEEIKFYGAKIDKNNNLKFFLSISNKQNTIDYQVNFYGDHYEMSIFNNVSDDCMRDKYSGIYYINKNKNGLTEYSFFDIKAYKTLYNINWRKSELFFYNSNFFYKNGFNPDWYCISESNNQLSEEQLSKELNTFIHNVGFNYSKALFDLILDNYEPIVPELSLIIK